jgi:hypothetical protein
MSILRILSIPVLLDGFNGSRFLVRDPDQMRPWDGDAWPSTPGYGGENADPVSFCKSLALAGMHPVDDDDLAYLGRDRQALKQPLDGSPLRDFHGTKVPTSWFGEVARKGRKEAKLDLHT